MKRLITILMALAGLLSGARETLAQSAARPAGFDDFKLVKTRNIFDPNRRAMRTESPREARSEGTRITRANTLSLTGTMVTEGRTLAFFHGSRSEDNKVIGVGESVADYKVKAITGTQVELEQAGKTAVLAVGGTPLTLEGSTEVVVNAGLVPDAPPDTSTAAPPSTAAGAPAPSNDKNDVLRRMMERRAKEMNK